MFNISDKSRNEYQLTGPLTSSGYDSWRHSFTGRDAETGEEKSFFIEFFVINPALGGDKPVFGQTRPVKPSKRRKKKAAKPVEKKLPSYVMVKAGAWGEDAAQLHRFFGVRKCEITSGQPLYVSAGDCFLCEDGTKGTVCVTPEDAEMCKEWMSDAGKMEWSLVFEKKIAFNVGYGAGERFRNRQLFEMFWHAEGMKTLVKGQVRWNERLYNVVPQKSFGYADKRWGRDFTSPWVWLSSCDLKSEKTGKFLRNSAFDIGGGCPKVGRFALKRKFLSAFYYEGQEFEFNFSKFWMLPRTKFNCYETKKTVVWHVEQKTWRNKVVVDITCRKKDMLLMNYEAPDGVKRHNRLWNGGTGWGAVSLFRDGALVDKLYARHVGCEYGKY